MANAAQRSRGHRNPPGARSDRPHQHLHKPPNPSGSGSVGIFGLRRSSSACICHGWSPSRSRDASRGAGDARYRWEGRLWCSLQNPVCWVSPSPCSGNCCHPAAPTAEQEPMVLSPAEQHLCLRNLRVRPQNQHLHLQESHPHPKTFAGRALGSDPRPRETPRQRFSSSLHRKGQEQLLQETLQQKRQWLWKHALPSALRWNNRLGTGGLRAAHRCPGDRKSVV